MDEPSQSACAFPQTHWSVVLAAGEPDSPRASAALEELCRAYWFPLYAFARRLGREPVQAEDLTQGFFQHALESGLVGKITPGGGRFRSFLLASFKHFMADQRDRAVALKRGGGRTLIPLDTQAAEDRIAGECASAPTPEAFYDRSWALVVVKHALQRMETEFGDAGRGQLFQTLQPYLQGDSDLPGYDEVAGELGTTEGTVRVMVSRMRRRYRELMRASVAQTVADAAEVEEEMRHLLAALNC